MRDRCSYVAYFGDGVACLRRGGEQEDASVGLRFR